MIIQVPLKQTRAFVNEECDDFSYGGGGIAFPASSMDQQLESAAPPSNLMKAMSLSAKREARNYNDNNSQVNVEDAIVKLGDSEGKFEEVEGMTIERDTDYPIRVTLQFYKSTDSGAINEDVISVISKQFEVSRKNADYIGSLVITPDSQRPTESAPPTIPSPVVIPPWWNQFWVTYKGVFPQYTEDHAKQLVFNKNNRRFENSSLIDVQDQVLNLLGMNENVAKPPPVNWGVL